ncbi:MAG: alpha/beta hydrolase [Rhizobium sp.]|nr:alpha/beta hydrolase [Rhizobium sp.]
MTETTEARRYWKSETILAPEVRSPLAQFNGERPPAPEWFENALRDLPLERRVKVDGVEIEVLEWGVESALPSLFLLHGTGASADWWRFIAPFLAQERRVVAMSWSGMGGSGWRKSYSFESYASEAEAIARAIGLFSADEAPILIGHSMGGMVGTLCCSRPDNSFRAIVAIDSGILDYRPPADWRELENHARIAAEDWPSYNLYPTLPAALLRYRFLPPQSSANGFITDYIARSNLRELAMPDGRTGWTWRSDPKLRFLGQEPDFFADRLPKVNRPMVLIRGGISALIPLERFRLTVEKAPPGTLGLEIPEAGHHVMVDQPLALVAALGALCAAWPPATSSDPNGAEP